MIEIVVFRDNRIARVNPPVADLEQLHADPAVMLWMDISEPVDDEAKGVLSDLLQIHPLTIEDCLLDTPLPKMELYDNYLYLVMHAADYSRAKKFTTTEVDFILGEKFLVTMHRRPLKPVEVVRARYVRSPGTQVRGPDRIAHNVLDLLVDNYRPAMAELRSEVEKVEEAVLEHTARNLDHEIVELREDLASLRQIIRPQRELALELSSGATRFFRRKLLPYMRDLHDELLGIEELAISWSEQMILVFRVYLNRSSHEANKGIRVLTTLTAVTIPLLLVGSLFSMNFRNMPLLRSHAAYWVTLGFTIATTGALLVFLRKRRWF